MDRSDTAVLSAIDADILQAPDLIARTITKALERIRPDAEAATAKREELDRRLAVIDRDLDRLTAAITAGGELATIIEAMRSRERERASLRSQISRYGASGEARGGRRKGYRA